MVLIAAKDPLSIYDMGAIAFIFIIAAGLLRLLTFVIKAKYKEKTNEPCKALKSGVCPLFSKFTQLTALTEKIYQIHCGPQALGKDGVPRWYLPEDILFKIKEVHEILSTLKNTMKIHLEHSKGNSGRISKDSIELYKKICTLIDPPEEVEDPVEKIEIDTSTGKIKLKKKSDRYEKVQ